MIWADNSAMSDSYRKQTGRPRSSETSSLDGASDGCRWAANFLRPLSIQPSNLTLDYLYIVALAGQPRVEQLVIA